MKYTHTALNRMLLLVASLGFMGNLAAENIAQPPVQLTDKNGVNVMGAQLNVSIGTVAIGGSMGLTHGFSVHNNRVMTRDLGPTDKFWGTARYTEVARGRYYKLGVDPLINPAAYLMRVTDGSESVDFIVMSGSDEVTDADAFAGYNYYNAYSYAAFKDSRHTLENIIKDGLHYLLWIKPDGTEVWFWRGNKEAKASAKGYLSKIVYPNGFTVTVNPDSDKTAYIQSVVTNTGFQLRYNYIPDKFDPDIKKVSFGDTGGMPDAFPMNWALANPKSIVAINNSIEYCDGKEKTRCVNTEDIGTNTAPDTDKCNPISSDYGPCTPLTKHWPTATFTWPQGMPRTVFTGDPLYNNEYSIFTVTDAHKTATKFKIQSFDTALNDGKVMPGYTKGVNFTPRLVNVTSVGNAINTTYTYKNEFGEGGNASDGYGFWAIKQFGILTHVKSLKNYSGYGTVSHHAGQVEAGSDWAGGGIYTYDTDENLGALIKVRNATEGTWMFFEYKDSSGHARRNFPIRFTSDSEPSKDYEYDDRNNLYKVTSDDGAIIEAHYPSDCPASQRKYCNQAEWIKDAMGKTTTYTYHPESGQVATITFPANAQGKIAKKRYEYKQKVAHFFGAGGGSGFLPSIYPIWLKTEERTCADTVAGDTTGDNCAPKQEIITAYEYESNNLLLTATTVTGYDALGNCRKLRTGYRYDIYGNQIGKTQPKAYTASCN